MDKVKAIIQTLTDKAESLGADANDSQCIVRAIVTAHGLGFYAWFCVCCELAERKAKRMGFDGEVDRAYTLAVSNHLANSVPCWIASPFNREVR